jgi:2-polyprenyl-3-methyl-5-hydroxy-6-metoxy-1,4-benzoquinol methylase
MPKSAQFFPNETELDKEKGDDLTVCQCTRCGLVQLNNDPVFYYREVVRSAAVSEEMTSFRLEQFSAWLKQYQLEGKKLVEIGCGAGEYMGIMNQFDVGVHGIEQRQQSVELGRESELHIQHGFVDDVEIDGAPFDGFYMLNFLEHLPDPNTTLKHIAQSLKKGAIGLVEVPNFDMIIRQKLFSEFISDHLFYFTKESFRHTLERNGFEVLECIETWHDYSLSAVVKKRSLVDLQEFKLQRSMITEKLTSYIAMFDDKKVAIWGAGHQALAVLSLSNLDDKVRYVVDSAPFKQNLYTPATHIPVVASKKLEEDPVEAVIVMAASYSDEVAKIVMENYPKVNVAVLRDNGLEIVKDLTIV